MSNYKLQTVREDTCGCGTGSPSCVRSVPIFQGLTDAEVALLSASIRSHVYRKGDYMFRCNEPSDTLYIIHAGCVKVSSLSEEGKEHVLRLLFPGDFAGQFAMFQHKLHYADAEALENTSVCHIQRDDLKQVLESNPELAFRFLAAMTERLRVADDWAGSMSLLDVEQRVAKGLLFFLTKSTTGNSFHLPVAKRDFASLIGITPETLSRKLTSFEDKGWIRLNGKSGVTVLDSNALDELI